MHCTRVGAESIDPTNAEERGYTVVVMMMTVLM